MHSIAELLRVAESARDGRDQKKALNALRALEALPVAAAEDLNRAGLAYYQMSLFDRAEKCFRKALRSCPDAAAYLNNLGLALFNAGKTDDAETVFHDALAKNPDAAMTRLHLGLVHEAQNRLEEARDRFSEEIGIHPSAAAYCGLAAVHDRLGNVSEARRCVETALREDPGHVNATRLLAQLSRRAGDAAAALALVDGALRQTPSHPGLLYECGHILHDLGRFPEAFERFKEANRLKDRKTVTRARFLAETKSIATLLNKLGKNGAAPGFPRADTGPVFLVGSPRSGTTLTAAMLGMHSKIKNADELETVPQTYGEANRLLGSPNDVGKILASVWHPRNASLPAHLCRHYRGLLSAVATEGKPYLLDKLPSNARRLAFIALIAPGAPVIHVIRDGREVAFSAFTQDFRKDTWHSHDLADAMIEWESTVKLARAGATALKLPYYEVKYEDLVADPRGVVGGILGFLGLKWEDACLDYHEGAAPSHTASYHQVRRKVFASSLGKAQNYPEQYAMMTEMAGETLKDLGYVRSHSP